MSDVYDAAAAVSVDGAKGRFTFDDAPHLVDEIFVPPIVEQAASAQLPTAVPLTRRVLDRMASRDLDTAGEVVVAAADVFTSASRFAADREMMRRTPHVVAWGGEIPCPGDYTTKDVAGAPVLLVRGKDGQPRAFLNVCAHRGAQVASGCGHATRFTCPYHAWSYATDGRLATMPSRSMFDGIDRGALALTPLPASEQAGLIVVALDDAVRIADFLEPVAAELAGFGFGRYAHSQTLRLDLRANWKLAVDVNFEGYHFPFLHQKTLAPICTNNSVFDVFGQHCRWAFPFRNIEELRGQPEADWPPRFSGTVVYGAFPSCVLIESPVSTQMLRIYPGDTPGTCVVYITGGSFEPITDDDTRALCEMALEGANAVLRDEDFPAAESCQIGAEQGGRDIIFGRCEPLVQHLHRVWDEALSRPTPSTAGV